MNIEDLYLKSTDLEENFSYKFLYNDSRGAIFKDEHKTLIREAMSKGIITVEKFVLAKDVQDELYLILERTKGLHYTLIECLKDYHNESDFEIALLIYLLRKLDPQFLLDNMEGMLRVKSSIVDVEIRPRIDGKNATPRIFLPKEKIAFASTNDNIENLSDILAVRDVKVYIIGKDNRSKDIYLYKINREDRYFEVAEGYIDSIRNDLFNKVRKYEI